MHKHSIGEWTLGQLVTPERAAAIVGDLEQNGVGCLQFWMAMGSSVLFS